MSKKSKAGVVGAITALAGLPAAAVAAEPPAVAPALSYADLLQPIPNAVERLKLANAQDAKLIKTRMQAQHHHHAQTAGHHHHAQTAHHHHAQTAHHHHAQTAHHHHAQTAHHHHAQTTK